MEVPQAALDQAQAFVIVGERPQLAPEPLADALARTDDDVRVWSGDLRLPSGCWQMVACRHRWRGSLQLRHGAWAEFSERATRVVAVTALQIRALHPTHPATGDPPRTLAPGEELTVGAGWLWFMTPVLPSAEECKGRSGVAAARALVLHGAAAAAEEVAPEEDSDAARRYKGAVFELARRPRPRWWLELEPTQQKGDAIGDLSALSWALRPVVEFVGEPAVAATCRRGYALADVALQFHLDRVRRLLAPLRSELATGDKLLRVAWRRVMDPLLSGPVRLRLGAARELALNLPLNRYNEAVRDVFDALAGGIDGAPRYLADHIPVTGPSAVQSLLRGAEAAYVAEACVRAVDVAGVTLIEAARRMRAVVPEAAFQDVDSRSPSVARDLVAALGDKWAAANPPDVFPDSDSRTMALLSVLCPAGSGEPALVKLAVEHADAGAFASELELPAEVAAAMHRELYAEPLPRWGPFPRPETAADPVELPEARCTVC